MVAAAVVAPPRLKVGFGGPAAAVVVAAEAAGVVVALGNENPPREPAGFGAAAKLVVAGAVVVVVVVAAGANNPPDLAVVEPSEKVEGVGIELEVLGLDAALAPKLKPDEGAANELPPPNERLLLVGGLLDDGLADPSDGGLLPEAKNPEPRVLPLVAPPREKVDDAVVVAACVGVALDPPPPNENAGVGCVAGAVVAAGAAPPKLNPPVAGAVVVGADAPPPKLKPPLAGALAAEPLAAPKLNPLLAVVFAAPPPNKPPPDDAPPPKLKPPDILEIT